MLHEIILSLLGFTGDIIKKTSSSYAVDESFDLLTESEKEQVNRIVHLGWFYDFLSQYIQTHELRWGGADVITGLHAYKAAFCIAINDVIEEYVEDVTEIENKILADGPVPLSFIAHHMQKYMITLPAIHTMCVEVERRGVHGCQLLDYLMAARSGVPVVSAVVQRMILRVRVVFLKQTIGWMLHGVLHDPGAEFFIQAKSTSSEADGTFDWSGTYTLRLECVPESHVSPRLAAKVVFAGKAVKLLQQSTMGSVSGSSLSALPSDPYLTDGEVEVLSYLGGKNPNIQQDENLSKDSTSISIPNTSVDACTVPDGGEGRGVDGFDVEEFARRSISEQSAYWPESVENSGERGLEILERCTKHMHEILCKPDLAVELYEGLVEDLHERASQRLWRELKDRRHGGFFQHLHVMRNTFLLGKGELYQALLDNLLLIVEGPLPSPGESSHKLDKILQSEVMRKTARALNIDDEALCGMFSLRLIANSLAVSDFSAAAVSGGEISLSGAARARRVGKGGRGTSVRIGGGTAEDPAKARQDHWRATMLHMEDQDSMQHDSEKDCSIGSLDRVEHNPGGVWLAHERYVAKGFTAKVNFTCGWTGVLATLVPGHPIMDALTNSEYTGPAVVAGGEVLVGGISWVIHGGAKAGGDAAGTDQHELGIDIPGSVSVGVSFHVRRYRGVGDIEMVARVFVRVCPSPSVVSGNRSVGGSISLGFGSTNERLGSVNTLVCEEIQLYTGSFEAWQDSPRHDPRRRAVGASSALTLEVEYSREVVPVGGSRGSGKDSNSSGVVHKIKGVLREQGRNATEAHAWDVETAVTLENQMRLHGGRGFVGTVASGSTLPHSTPPSFYIDISAVDFRGRGAPGSSSGGSAASAHILTRHPLLFSRLEDTLARYRYWLNLRLTALTIPTVFRTIFDPDAMKCYGSMFTLLLKVRLVVYVMERRSVVTSGSGLGRSRRRGGGGTRMSHLRHSMLFFSE
mmetsp:Transcript_5172/g.7923  ORF Transcript_5172/g.7923 Transcript_5172/m.7923 type:complete len:973 (+) Transcript_5172:207-3125(+)